MYIFDKLLTLNIEEEYVMLFVFTILTILIKRLVMFILKKLFIMVNNSNKTQYKLIQFFNILATICELLIIYLLWDSYIKGIITLITFISTAIALSLKDIIFNLFSGIYIKVNKPFILEDRIEINGYKGDVINIGTYSFELLEISDEYGNQSTGVVLELPNSIIFSHPIKNYIKGFSYIWDEIDISLELDSNLEECKNILYKIVSSTTLLKGAPNKMKKELKKNINYRMYFNKFDPVIYTEVVGNKILLNIRYLVDPKKSRIVKSHIWNEVLNEYKAGNITLKKD